MSRPDYSGGDATRSLLQPWGILTKESLVFIKINPSSVSVKRVLIQGLVIFGLDPKL